MKDIYIDGKPIGKGRYPFIIAEAGVNHEGDPHLARALAEVGAWAGVDALKVQTFKADLIVTRNAEKAKYQQENLGTSDSQYEMLQKLELNDTQHRFLKSVCEEAGMTFLSTPHSGEWSVDYLTELGVPAFKIASPDLTNIPFIEYVARKGKPMILSTGMGTLDEVVEAVEAMRSQGNNQIVALHCTSNYPCPLDEVNLRAMHTIRDSLGIQVGYSDHTNGVAVPIMATAMGAVILEKHFTLDQKIRGNSPDHTSSLTPSQLKEVVEAVRFTQKSGITDPAEALNAWYNHKGQQHFGVEHLILPTLGTGTKEPTESELKIMHGLRKSTVATREIKQGEILTTENTGIKRPMNGIKPKYYEELITIPAQATRDIQEDEHITEENCDFREEE